VRWKPGKGDRNQGWCVGRVRHLNSGRIGSGGLKKVWDTSKMWRVWKAEKGGELASRYGQL